MLKLFQNAYTNYTVLLFGKWNLHMGLLCTMLMLLITYALQ